MTPTARPDSRALVAGVVFCVAFTALVSATGSLLASVPHQPDQGAAWYYWKLASPTWVTRVTVWSLYLAHQLAFFWILARAQARRPAYGHTLHRENLQALALNGTFAVVHLAQTHLTYDGLAQDVHIFSSLGSVAVLLIWVLLMEAPRRGLFFGRTPPLPPDVVAFARRHHGYYFSWAITYTFWFHPAESTHGHLMGFMYTLLVMLQGSLFFTRVHTNRWWTLTLELLVVAHGTLVALDQGSGLWPMFLFGFLALFVVSQMHGLGLPLWARAAIALGWLGGAAAAYSAIGLTRVNEVLRIPVIDYLGVFVLTGLLWAGLRGWKSLTT